MGIDGAGKTTLAKTFIEKADKIGLKYKYVWGNAEPIFIRPARAIAHLTFLRNVDMHTDHDRYENVKEKISSKHHVFSSAYSSVLLFDYFVWLFFKVKLPLYFGRRIICDRYVFDVAINLYFLNKVLFADIQKTIKLLLKYFPKPDFIYLVDIPASVAFRRKSDIPSIGFLKKREAMYRRLSEIFGARKLNGNQPVADSIKIIIQDIKKERRVDE
jgi:dTMP kinase